MPRYFFNVDDGKSAPDTEGLELNGRAEAWSMATQLMGDIIRDLDGKQDPGSGWSLAVVESGTQTCWRLSFTTEAFVPDPRMGEPGS